MEARELVPNESFLDVYEQLGELLSRGDDAFIEAGPPLVEAALLDSDFLEGVETEPAGEVYTRTKVMGRPGEHVIRFMEWPPNYALMPHEHHGRPCFEVLVEGTMILTDMKPVPIGDDRYRLHREDITICGEGECGVVDPRTGYDVHAVYSPVRARSLHVYPDDKHFSYGYVLVDEGDETDDYYRRKRFELDVE